MRIPIVVLALALTNIGCASKGGLIGGPDDPALHGVRYRLPVDVVVLNGMLTTTRTRQVSGLTRSEDQASGSITFTVNFKETTEAVHDAKLALQPVADPSRVFRIDLVPASTKDAKLNVKLGSSSLLQSINVESAGRGPEILKSVGSLLGRAVSFAATGNPLASTQAGGPAMAGTTNACRHHEAPDLVDLPLERRAMLVTRQGACAAFRELQVLRAHAFDVNERLNQASQPVGAATEAELKVIKTRLDLLQRELVTARQSVTDQAVYLDSLQAEFRKEHRLGTVVTDRPFDYVFDLASLESNHGGLLAAETAGAARKLLMPQPSRLRALDDSGIVLLATRVSTPSSDVTTEGGTPGAGIANVKGKEFVLFYRQSEATVFRLLTTTPPEGTDDESKNQSSAQVALAWSRQSDAVHADSPIKTMAFESSAFGNRALALTFDAGGRPIEIQQSGTSSAAAVVGALDAGSAALLETYAETLKKTVDVQANRRTLALSSAETRLQKLKKDKELLDAELALSNGTATAANTLRQQQLTSELATLQAELLLASAQASAEVVTDTALLKAQVERLNAEIAVLKAKVEADRLKAGGGF